MTPTESAEKSEATPRFRAELPAELEGMPDEPFVEVDLDRLEGWMGGTPDPWLDSLAGK